MTAPTSSARAAYRPWFVRTVVVRLSRKLSATYRIRSDRRLSRLLATLLAAVSPWATALPEGAQVVAGQASVSTPSANAMVVNQTSDKAVLNWQSFNIGVGQSMQFVQPGVSSVALNRVIGNGASSIFGSLSANGQVFLINPAGVMFAPGAQVNVGGLVASSLDIGNGDFMAGRYTFSGNGTGAVSNHGSINAARGGYVLLAAPQVSNTGAITADAGSVGLLAGSRVSVDTSGVGLVRFSVDAAAAQAAIINSGSITAAGGQVAVLASAMGDALATVINQSGVIRANSAVERNGTIVLSGGGRGVVHVSGTLDASGTAAGQSGGTVQVLGDKVALDAGSTIDVSGTAGGGTALVGGDYQGSNAAVQNASRTYVAAGAAIRADATNSGKGGKVVVWADGDTRHSGAISARGANGGDGGFVEVSGKQQLDLRGSVDVAAPAGTGGTVLLDPQDILINATVQPSPFNNTDGTPDVAFADPPSPTGTYTIQIADVTGYSELYLQASRNITLASALAMTAGNKVRFEAGNTIALNAALTASGGVNLSAASITSTAAGIISTNGAGNTSAGNVTLNATGSINLAGGISATGGAATAGNPGQSGGAVSITGAGVTAAAITANGSAGSGATQTGGAGGNISITSTNGIAGTGTLTASGATAGTGVATGGNAGSIILANSGAGNIALAGLTASTGNATTTGAGGAAGSISVTNSAAGASLGTGNITTVGGANGNGGTITLNSAGALSAGTVTSSGGGALANTSGRNAGAVNITAAGAITALGAVTANGTGGNTAGNGGNAGAVSISAAGGITSAAITASGGAGVGINASGGNAGTITVVNSGTGNITAAALTAQTGAATGTGTGGVAGSVSVSNSAAGGNLSTAAILTTGGAKGNGGNVSLSGLGQVSVLNNNITTSGGTTVSGLAGRDAGSVTVSGAGLNMGTGIITASGGAAAATSNQKGGSGAAVSITSTGAVTMAAITASGGVGGTTNGDGGNAGSISVANTVAGNVTTGALAAQSGNAAGTGAGGAAGSISLSNTAGNLTAGTLTTTGGTSGNGGNVSVAANSGAVVVGAIVASGGVATGTAGGRNAGTVSLTGAGVTTAAITANGTNGSTTGAGGNGGTVAVNSTAAVSTTGAISTMGGNGAGANQAGGQGAAVSLVSNGGNVSVAAITTTGGNGGTGISAGGNAGAITLDAAGGTPTITLAGNLTALGGNQVGGATSGNGGAIQVKDDALLNAATVTVDSRGGNAGVGAGANTQFDGAINSQTSGRTLVLRAGNADVAVTGTMGGTLALSALTVTANDIAVGAVGGASAGVTGATSLTATTAGADIGDIALNGALNVNALTLSAASALTQSNAIKATTASLTAGALNDITFNNTGNDFTGAVSVVSSRNVVLTDANALRLGTSAVSGTLAVNTTGLIDQSGLLTVTGATTLAAGAGNDITLNNAGNNFTGAVSVTSGNAVSLRDTNALVIGASNVSSSLALIAGAAITQTGAITAPTLTAKTLSAAAANITLNNTGNEVATVDLRARNVADTLNAAGAISYRDATGFDVAAVNTTGALTLQSNGNISQSGAVAAASLAVAGTGAGSLNLGTQANNIATLNAITAAGGFTLNNGNNSTTVAGNINTTSNAVAIDTGTGTYTQNNVDVVAGSGPITITADTVAIAANTGNNALATSGVLTLKAKTASRTMSLSGASGFDLTAAEVTAFATGATGPIVIGDTASTGAMTIGGAVGLAGKTLTLNAGSITDVGVQTITAQNVILNANGQIGTDASNGIDVAAGNLSVNTTGNANAFVRSTGAVNLGVGSTASNVGSGTLNLTALGAVTQTAGTGNITAGTLKVKTLVNAGGGITLSNSGNTNTAINLQARNAADTANAAGAIQYSSAAGFDVATVATTGNATLSAGGAVSQSGAILASGLALTGGTGAYTLANAGNAVTTLAASTGSVDYRQAGALVVGTVGATAGVTATGAVKIETTGAASNLTLNNAVNSSATGDAVILKAGSANAAGVGTGGQLVNNVGAGGIVAASGRYLVYSGDPGTTLEGVTGYSKRYNSDASYVPAGSANTFLYRVAPTLTATADNKIKVYGDTNPLLTGVVSGLIDGDTIAGLGVNYTTTAVDRTAVAAGPVAITAGVGTNSENYTLALTNGALTITQRALTVSATGQNRVYDGGVAATVTLTDNRLSGDVLTATNTAASFIDKNVGTGKTVNVSGIALTGADAGNYSANTTAATTANITQRALTVGATGQNRVYDGGTVATVTLADNRVAGDVLTATNTAASFGDKNVGTGKAVSVSGIAVTGSDAGNYTYNTTAAATADITQRALTVSATGQNRVYDGGTAATVTLADNRVAGDVLATTNTAASFGDKNVGTGKAVNVSGIAVTGTDAGNYTFNTTAATTANITQRALTVGATAQNKVYDGGTAATATLSDNRVAGDVLAASNTSASFVDKNAGVGKTVNVGGIAITGTDAANYSVNTTAATTANITPASIANVTGITAANKVQDGTTSATLATGGAAFTGRIGADVLTVGAATGNFDSPAVGNGKPVSITGITLSGADAGNYILQNATAATTANITPAPANTAERTGDARIVNGTALPVLEGDDRRQRALRRTAGIKNAEEGIAAETPTFRLAGFPDPRGAAGLVQQDCAAQGSGLNCTGGGQGQ